MIDPKIYNPDQENESLHQIKGLLYEKIQEAASILASDETRYFEKDNIGTQIGEPIKFSFKDGAEVAKV